MADGSRTEASAHLAAYALEVGAGVGAYNNLILTGGNLVKLNAVGGASDLIYQLAIKDAKDYNPVSTVFKFSFRSSAKCSSWIYV